MTKRPSLTEMSPLEVAIEPKIASDRGTLAGALQRLADTDASVQFAVNGETGQIMIMGTSEEHLIAEIEALRGAAGADFIVGAPYVRYLETITRKATIDYTHKKRDSFARVVFEFEPLPRASGFVFQNGASNNPALKEYLPGIERGVQAILKHGVLAGFPITDCKATLTDATCHDVYSSIVAFEAATCEAFQEGMPKASAVLLEPIMKIEVVTPEEFAIEVDRDLHSRRGHIRRDDKNSDKRIFGALIPISRMFGYENTLRSITMGGGTYSMTFNHYEPVPHSFDDDPTFRPAMGMRACRLSD